MKSPYLAKKYWEYPIPPLEIGQMVGPVVATIREGQTTPPKRYTEDTLLAAMETAGAKDAPDDAERKEMAKRYDDIINLSVGDPDYPADKTCIDLMYRDALAGHTRYTEFLGDPELREETIKMYKEDYGLTVGIDELLITAGGTHALYVVMQTLLDEGL